ncbi:MULTISPECIES: hypothetical protein [Planktothrix]|jgi:hypothetical protein|uniref:Uncharacterized protein n=3 Tax=Planktothrix TaxID=54304 RepID=A0A073CAK8_PLAA1|nr:MULTISPECIES: hypothetical protein [Planktothrix]MCF3608722.1 hypothetical protein [Planktothrix agardhii 1033]CAH2571599.1 hypothetical protein PRNO82_00997 [Planktothrix rubescens]BBD57117.1 hypothetical protein NIES204_44530 [Planktothrix agardhii NIES-204]KEI65156.1 hypothetical protein A19Y_8066 [Planktothrix agardhii NIVA-CYA 126/8]MCB8753330.1 hypothetical protein [Planktothrix agardhii 1810]
MPYSNFTLRQVEKDFHLQIEEKIDLFAHIEAIAPSDDLKRILAENIPLALAINTEKARSEFLIAPTLLELRRRSPTPVSLFSGTEFSISPEQGLSGYCDYLISLSKQQLMISAPVVAIVEAKNEDIKSGLGQCIAEMIAAQLFNEQENNDIKTIYGIVTSGEIWKFLQISEQTVVIDLTDYYITNIDKILGILLQLIPAH